MRASAACDPMKFHDGPPVNAQEIVPLIWQSFSCNLRSKKCLRPLEMHLSVSHPVRYPMDMILQLLYHSASCFASAQFVHEVRNRQLIGVFFSGVFRGMSIVSAVIRNIISYRYLRNGSGRGVPVRFT